MKEDEFQQKLESQRRSPLIDNLSKYQHVERLKNSNVDGLLDGKVYIMPKIDGANLTVAWSSQRGYIIASRNNAKSVGGDPTHGFNGAIEYVLNHQGILELCKRFILRGEWLTKHTILYPPEIMKHFYVFDVQRYEDESYLTPEEYIPLLEQHGIKYVPVYQPINNPTIEELQKFVEGPSTFKELNGQKEGIVIKRYDFVNRFGRTTWGKIVNEDFQTQNKIVFNAPGKNAEIELTFIATYITQAFVLKTIEKIKEESGDITIKQMPRILGTVWYDLFTEELWDFVKKNKVQKFNFREAKKLCDNAVRNIALAYFNNTLKEF